MPRVVSGITVSSTADVVSVLRRFLACCLSKRAVSVAFVSVCPRCSDGAQSGWEVYIASTGFPGETTKTINPIINY